MAKQDACLFARSHYGKRIRLVIVTSHTTPLHSLLASVEFDLVGLVRDGSEIKRICPHVQPDIVMIDRQAAREKGAAIVQTIHSFWPWIQVLLVGDRPITTGSEVWHPEPGPDHSSGKPARYDLAEVVRNLYETRLLPFRHNGTSARLRAHPDYLFSDREEKVCHWIEAGADAVQIAERLAVNELTARFYIHNVKDKLERAKALKLEGYGRLVPRQETEPT